MRAGASPTRIEIFKLNVEDHPDSFNVHDSLGEAYAANGDRELAIKSYRPVDRDQPRQQGRHRGAEEAGGGAVTRHPTPTHPEPPHRARRPRAGI